MRGKSVSLFVSIVFVVFAVALISLPVLALPHVMDIGGWLVNPVSNSYIHGNITLNATPALSVNNVSFYYKDSTGTTFLIYTNITNGTELTYQWDTATVSDGVYDVIAIANNKTSISDESDNITIDNNAPLLDVTEPVDTTYTSKSVDLKYTVSDAIGIGKCWYILNSVRYDITSCGNVTMSCAEEDNSVTVYVNDTAGNENSSTVSFKVDTTAPTITVISPTSSNYGYTNILINASATDYSGVASVIAEINGTENVTLTNSGDYWYNTSYIFAEGTNTVKIYAADGVGNPAVTGGVTFIADVTVPDIYGVTISGPSGIKSGTIISILSNVSDNVDTDPAVSMSFINSTGHELETKTMTETASEVYEIDYTIPDVPTGIYTVRIIATDFVGNSATDDSSIIVDNTAPMLSNLTPSGITYDTTPELYLNTNEDSTCRFSDEDEAYENMTTFASTGSLVHSNQMGTLSIAIYKYYVKCEDVAENMAEGMIEFEVKETSGTSGSGPGKRKTGSTGPNPYDANNNVTPFGTQTPVEENTFIGGSYQTETPESNAAGPTGTFITTPDANYAMSVAVAAIISLGILWLLFKEQIGSIIARIKWKHY